MSYNTHSVNQNVGKNEPVVNIRINNLTEQDKGK